MQDVVYAMWACGQHAAHLDELADQALEVVVGRVNELSGGELAKLACGLMNAEVRDVRLLLCYSAIVCSCCGVHIREPPNVAFWHRRNL